MGAGHENTQTEMKCFHCQGQLQRGVTTFEVARKGYHLRIDQAPAWICNQCGEAMFDEEQSEVIQSMLRSLDQKTEDLSLAK